LVSETLEYSSILHQFKQNVMIGIEMSVKNYMFKSKFKSKNILLFFKFSAPHSFPVQSGSVACVTIKNLKEIRKKS